MYVYSAYGLNIHSDLPLPELLPGRAGAPDVIIRQHAGTAIRLLGRNQGGRFVGFVPGAGAFYMVEGRELYYEAEPGATEKEVKAAILGPVFATVLRQRGLNTIHASCAIIEDGAVLFIGQSGSGKSTTAAAFYREGFSIMADDLIAIRESEGRHFVVPGNPTIKLLPDTVDGLRPDPSELLFQFVDSNKVGQRASRGFPDRPFPIRKIYKLAVGSEYAIRALDPQTAFRELMSNLRAPNLEGPQFQASYLRHCASLVNAVPVVSLIRKPSLELLPELVRLVVEDVCVSSSALEPA